MPKLSELERIVIDRDTCIGCGACVATCPYQALELDESGKSRLIWDLCQSDFQCVAVCATKSIYKASEASAALKSKPWFKFSKQLSPEEQREFEEWCKKYGVTAPPIG
jgi:ferredoxin